MLDTFHPGLYGGTGRSRPLSDLRGSDLTRVLFRAALVPTTFARRPRFRPFAVDVASGVESAPGIKDHDKLRRFIRECQVCPIATAISAIFGGKYVAETLMPALAELEHAYEDARRDPAFKRELENYSREFVGRPTPLYFAANLTARLGGAKIYLKREDLCHTGAHKVNNALGQALLAVRMGKTRITAETGAGQHGVAAATMAALFKRECEVFMGTARRRAPVAQRVPHEAARRKSHRGRFRQQQPEGRAQRGAARLDRDGAQHLLPDRQRCRVRIRTR